MLSTKLRSWWTSLSPDAKLGWKLLGLSSLSCLFIATALN